MPKFTENLNLFEYDVEKDGKNTYNISQCLNDNWDKIDSALGNVANLTTEQKANFVSAINEIVSNLDKKSSIDLNNLSALGQSILDRKVEVEALLQQNGYAKFSWKEDNEISILLLQWGRTNIPIYNNSNSTLKIIFPIAFTTNYSSFANGLGISIEDGSGVNSMYTYPESLSYLWIVNDGDVSNTSGAFWFAIGT